MNPIERLLDKMGGLSTKKLVMIGGGLVFGLAFLIGIALYSVSDSDKPAEEAPKPTTMKVVVMKQDVASRVTVTEDMVKLVDAPPDLVPDDAYTDITDVVGKTLKTMVETGEVLTRHKIAEDDGATGFAGVIPPDMRAVTIGLSNITGGAGLVRPGDFVDILAVEDSNGTQKSRIILQNVLVLAVNKNYKLPEAAPKPAPNSKDSSSDNKDGDAKKEEKVEDVSSMTFAVRPEDAAELAMAIKKGNIMVALRPFRPTDEFTTATTYVDPSSKAVQSAPAAPAPAVRSTPAPAVAPAPVIPAKPTTPADNNYGIEVIRGTESSRGK